MEDLRIRFIDECYNDAITLKEKFKITESKEWDAITVLLELGVQIGHIFDIKCNNDSLREIMREKQLLQLEYDPESNKKEIIDDIIR